MDGTFTWENLDIGFGDKYEFEVKYRDKSGIVWKGEISDKIRGDTIKDIVLREAYVEELGTMQVSGRVEEFLRKSSSGKEILDAMRELSIAAGNGLSRSAVSLSTYILEGMIQIKARLEGIWIGAFENMTFGQLIKEEKIKHLFLPGILDKLEGLNKLRIGASHFKSIKTIESEAQIAIAVIREISTSWFDQQLATSNSGGRTSDGATS